MRKRSAISLVSFISPTLFSSTICPPNSFLRSSRASPKYYTPIPAQNACSAFYMSIATDAGPPQPPASVTVDPTVQYVVVRRDLMDTWPTGSVIAQAVHASVAAVWESKSDSITKAYCGQSGNNDAEQDSQSDNRASTQMHTVVLEAKNEAAVLKLADKLRDNDIKFVMWREQPENIVTALAARPYPRSEVKKLFNKYKLFK